MKLPKAFLIFCLLVSIFNTALSQDADYSAIFGDDWKKAEQFEAVNRYWIKPVIEEYGISYPVAMSVIFPELVRFSALRDMMETTMLKILYINLGQDYANFSIGQFQMKPSFAELLREKASSLADSFPAKSFLQKNSFNDIRDFRRSIIADLEDTRTQLLYLVAFIKVCENEYDIKGRDESSMVKLLSTAYNYGLGMKIEEIEKMTGRKYYTTKLIGKEFYPYADVALFWFNRYNNSNIIFIE
jgi:hypothetical protein